MKFALVLLVLGWRLRWLAWRNAGFRKQLENRNVIMQWRTFKGKPARSFHFTPGKVVSSGGLHDKPTVTLNFKDASYAFRTLQVALQMQRMASGKSRKTATTFRPCSAARTAACRGMPSPVMR